MIEGLIEVIVCLFDGLRWDDSAIRWPWSPSERRRARSTAPVGTDRDTVVGSPAARSTGAIDQALGPARNEFDLSSIVIFLPLQANAPADKA